MTLSTSSSKPNAGQRGTTSVEFVLVACFFFAPLIVGTVTTGFSLIRGMQAVEITRDSGHMFGKGVDFSVQSNQDIIVNQIGAALGLSGNGGNVTGGTSGSGVIVLSAMTYIGAAQCTSCANLNHTVVTRRIVIGNKNLYKSAYGGAMTVDSSTGAVQNYLTDTHAQADKFSNLLTLNSGEMAFLAESYFLAQGPFGAPAYNFVVF